MKSDSGSAWPAAIVALLAGLAVVLVVFRDAFAGAVATWNASAAHQFSYLVLPVSLYFVWLRRRRLAQMHPSPDLRMVWLVLPCGLLWLVSHVAQIAMGVQLAAVGMAQILVLVLLGREVCRVVLFPLLFLWLLVPFGDSLVVPLMELTSAMTVAGLGAAGLDAQAEGTVLIAEGARYLIVEQCAALDFIIGNLVISLVYANLMYGGALKRWVYSLAAVPVAILANGLRTTSIVFITHVSDGALDLASDHAVYGWLVFALAVAGQMAIGWWFRDPHAPAPERGSASMRPRASLHRLLVTWLVAVVAITAAPGYAAWRAEAVPEAGRLCWPALPIAAATAAGEPAWQPRFPRAQGRLHALVESELGAVDLHIAYYWRQHPGSELITWGNRLYDGSRWRFLARGSARLIVDGVPLSVTHERLRDRRYRTRTVFYWYWVDGEMSASVAYAKLLQVKSALLGGERRAALIALSVDERRVADARPAAQWVLDRVPPLGQTLQRVSRVSGEETAC